MKLFYLTLSLLFSLNAELLFELNSPLGTLFISNPSWDEFNNQSAEAKNIFVEAFSTTYTEYYGESGSQEPIEKWLKLKSHFTLASWLSNVFDDEKEEYLQGLKKFIFVHNQENKLIGWLSYSPLSETGEIYLSQCSLEASSRDQRVATTAFSSVFKEGLYKKLFPGVKEIKLITRKINTRAKKLYLSNGFIMDETIDPSIYGESYDDRYIGFRLLIEE